MPGAFKLEPYLEVNDMGKYNYEDIKIESGIEMPARQSGRPRKVRPVVTLLRKMRIGDSFTLEHSSQYSYIAATAKKEGIKVSMRVLEDGSIRVWKVKK